MNVVTRACDGRFSDHVRRSPGAHECSYRYVSPRRICHAHCSLHYVLKWYGDASPRAQPHHARSTAIGASRARGARRASQAPTAGGQR